MAAAGLRPPLQYPGRGGAIAASLRGWALSYTGQVANGFVSGVAGAVASLAPARLHLLGTGALNLYVTGGIAIAADPDAGHITQDRNHVSAAPCDTLSCLVRLARSPLIMRELLATAVLSEPGPR